MIAPTLRTSHPMLAETQSHFWKPGNEIFHFDDATYNATLVDAYAQNALEVPHHTVKQELTSSPINYHLFPTQFSSSTTVSDPVLIASSQVENTPHLFTSVQQPQLSSSSLVDCSVSSQSSHTRPYLPPSPESVTHLHTSSTRTHYPHNLQTLALEPHSRFSLTCGTENSDHTSAATLSPEASSASLVLDQPTLTTNWSSYRLQPLNPSAGQPSKSAESTIEYHGSMVNSTGDMTNAPSSDVTLSSHTPPSRDMQRVEQSGESAEHWAYDSDSDHSHSTDRGLKIYGKDRFFWQYNVHSKGPKGRRILSSQQLSDPFHVQQTVDPVFSTSFQAESIKHRGKARRGDGNDLTPRPQKLLAIRSDLDGLTRLIGDLGTFDAPTSPDQFNPRKEKNKLASRACRLKKKAQHEANKIQLAGLQEEHGRLLRCMGDMFTLLKQRVRYLESPILPYELTTDRIKQLHSANNGFRVAGRMPEYVQSVLSDSDLVRGSKAKATSTTKSSLGTVHQNAIQHTASSQSGVL